MAQKLTFNEIMRRITGGPETYSAESQSLSSKGSKTGTVRKIKTENGNYTAAQDWTGIIKADDQFIYYADGTVAALIEVDPISLSLLDDQGRESLVEKLADHYNSLQFNFQIQTAQRAVDLTATINSVETLMHNTSDATRRQLLSKKVDYLKMVMTNMESVETYYLIVLYGTAKKIPDLHRQIQVVKRAHANAGLKARDVHGPEITKTLASLYKQAPGASAAPALAFLTQ